MAVPKKKKSKFRKSNKQVNLNLPLLNFSRCKICKSKKLVNKQCKNCFN